MVTIGCQLNMRSACALCKIKLLFIFIADNCDDQVRYKKEDNATSRYMGNICTTL